MRERDAQRSRAGQVGMLMRAYRESVPLDDGGRGLTQEELLRRMATVDSDYAQRFSHTTVSRWESGSTRPNRERLEIFGKALNLSPAEVDGLISLAGLGLDDEPDLPGNGPDSAATAADLAGTETEQSAMSANRSATDPGVQSFQNFSPLVRHCVMACVLPGVVIVGGAYLLAYLGWNDRWMPISYIGVVVGVRLVAGFQKLIPPYDLCEFTCISVFVLLTTPLLQSAALHADHYGFYSIGSLAGTPMPYMLALLVNLALSTVVGIVFFALWKWQYSARITDGNSGRRAVTVVLPSIGVVYATVAVITNVGILLQLGVALAALSGALIILLWIRDPAAIPHEGDRRFLLWSILLVSSVMTAIGAASMLAIYLVPNLPSILPDSNLLYSWELNYAEFGLTRDEALARFNVGYLWHATTLFLYMVFVVGGLLIASVFRWGDGSAATPKGYTAAPGSGGPDGGSSIRRRMGAFFGVGPPDDWDSRSDDA